MQSLIFFQYIMIYLAVQLTKDILHFPEKKELCFVYISGM